MSTRACIAERFGDHWKGVYSHSDGYPTYLGQALFEAVRDQYSGDVRKFLDETVNGHPGGWSIFPERCYCHWEEHKDDGPMIIEGCDCNTNPYDSAADYGGYMREGTQKEPSCDPVFMEYVYVFDAHAKTMAILESYGEEIEHKPGDEQYHLNCRKLFRHAIKTVVRLNGPEPDWDAIEKAELQKPKFPRIEHAEAGQQTAIDDLPPRTIPDKPLTPKRKQTEKPTLLELYEEEIKQKKLF